MLRDALGRQFQRSLPEYLDGMITIASVKMSPDLRIAKVYVSIYRSATTPDILIKRMNTHMPEIRKRLAGEVEMKYLPELRFYRDDTLDAAERIDELLRSVRHDDEARRGEQTSDDEPNAGETNHGETSGDDDA
jgi:ribosome-binding factor A